jgi:hypothetical protein
MHLKAARMLRLDSELMDLRQEDLEDTGYNKPLVDITLASYENDDECENNTRFSKLEIMTMMHYLGFGDGSGYIRVYYNGQCLLQVQSHDAVSLHVAQDVYCKNSQRFG